MTSIEQKCGECKWFKQGRPRYNPRYSTIGGALELLKSGNPGQLPPNTGICEAPYQTFAGRKQAPGFITFLNQSCDARDSDQKLLFQPKK